MNWSILAPLIFASFSLFFSISVFTVRVNKTNQRIISKFRTSIFQMTLVGAPNVIETADSSYEDYADNFDLSLLSMDNEFNSLVNGE